MLLVLQDFELCYMSWGKLLNYFNLAHLSASNSVG